MSNDVTRVEIHTGDRTAVNILYGEWFRTNFGHCKTDMTIVGLGKLDTNVIYNIEKGFLTVLDEKGIQYKEV